jgi:large subunit ribosomal protein L6
MSRTGKNPIHIEKDVNIEISNNLVKVSGPKGSLEYELPKNINVKKENNTLFVERNSEDRFSRSNHGLSRSLIFNMVNGVSKGYKKILDIVGVGYKAQIKNNILTLNVGYNHPVYFVLPDKVKASMEGNNKIVLESIDKQLVGELAAQIRKVRLPEPYKGKGIKYSNEIIKKKAGKTVAGK